MRHILATAFIASALLAGPALAELPDLGGEAVTVVTENAYPPLQFVDPKRASPLAGNTMR